MHPDDDPYADDGSGRLFWADAAADRVLDGDPEEPIVIKGGISPSGVPHLGNMNEIMRGYFVAAVLRERGHEVRQVFTSDDRDPLRGLPRKLADLDGEVVALGDVNAGALGQNLGAPYTEIPDPFGCCNSYGAHFSNLIQSSAARLGVDVEMVSNTETYANGGFEEVTRYLLEHVTAARDVLGEYQDKVDEEYVPFNPICEACGKVTETVTDVDADAGTVEYVCTDMDAGDQTIEGCGHEGTATLREGKLPWRFEWPAQWRTLGVDYEPFGKDHAEGSWPSGTDISRNVLGDEPPTPMVYEWFTLDGEPFSSSAGHVILVQDVLALLELPVVRYFFSKDPRRARDFSIEHLDQLVDEFDRMERVYFGEAADASEDERERAARVYPLLVDDIDADRVRIPFTFAAVLGMTEDSALREEIARREGHIPADADADTVADALTRVERAREWARRTNNEFNYRLARAEIPAHDFDDATAAALDELAAFLDDEDPDGEALQGEIYEAAKRHDIDIGAFFAAGYRLFFDEDQGPKLGPFLAKLDREFVVTRLRREG
ncbi:MULTISPECIES: lysine--tRNA ligase [Halobacterium]|uniref:lysine--tRNA ligase n=1 Tax=Halobacterium TaxID=2239 RepID=UPI001965A5B3|nr:MULTISPECIES: lysine--tRNA ligase [Halobacterium]MDL0134936.1 lysine--tRNA ligase [Halobacterium salinarum]QRY24321.1 lysine--tRNA ligase [Halobacterium sp. BOL4-2]